MASKTQRELALMVTGKDVSASKTLRGVGREMNSLTKIAGKAGSNVTRNLERGVVIGATAAAGALGYAAHAAMEFESSSASVAKTVGEGWERIVEANREMALSIPVDVNTLNEIAASAAAMGVAGDDVTSFTKTLALLTQTADDVDAATGGEFLGHLRTNMRLTGPEIEHLGDLVTHLGNNSAATEGQILSMAEGVSGAAGFIDASTDDVVAWSAAMASAGEESEAGGSAIQRVWIDSAKFVAEAGDEMKLMAKISGVSLRTFRRNFEQDGAKTLAVFVDKLGELTTAEQLAILEALGWDDIRITRAMGKLLANTDNLTNAYEQTGQAAGASAREAEVRFATTASQIQLLKNNVNDAAIVIGQELLPVIAELAAEGVDWLKGHQPEIAQFAKDLGVGIREAVTWAQKLDWESIGSSVQTAATASQALVQAFLGMPEWVKTAVVTGWGLNKLTGGAVVDFGKLIFQRGMTPATPMFVSVVGAGGLPGGAGGAASGGLSALGKVFLVGEAIGLITAVDAVRSSIQGNITGQAQGLSTQTGAFLGTNPGSAQLETALAGIDAAIRQLESDPLAVALVTGPALEELKAMRARVAEQLAALGADAVRQTASSERLEAMFGPKVTEAAKLGVVATERAEANAAASAAQIKAQLAAGDTRSEQALIRTGGVITSRASADSRSEQSQIDRAAAASRVAGQVAASAIKDKDMSVSLTNNVSTIVSVRDTVKKTTSRTKFGIIAV